MSRTQPPLLGFNNNVRHQGRIFHIQTEGSGAKYPRIVTHLFADGGRIVKTARTDYSEHVGREDIVPVARRLMKKQHKAMFIALRSGEYDALIEEVYGSASRTAALPAAEQAAGVISEPDIPAPAPAGAPAAEAPAPPPRRKKKLARRLSNPNLRRVTPSVAPPAVDFELDVDSLDAHPPRSKPMSRPPPAPAPSAETPRSRPIPPRGTPAYGTPPVAAGPGKYALSRPAAIFSEPPSPGKRSIFDESMISEKSLDDVILSFLAEDLEGSPD